MDPCPSFLIVLREKAQQSKSVMRKLHREERRMLGKRVAPTVKGWIKTLLFIIQLSLMACVLVVAEVVMWLLSSQYRKALRECWYDEHD